MIVHLRGRLFWKILCGFLVIFFLISQLLWLGFNFYGRHHQLPPDDLATQRIAETQLFSAAIILQRDGMDGLNELISHWSAGERHLLTVTPVQPGDPASSTSVAHNWDHDDPDYKPQTITEQVKSSDGQNYLLRYNVQALHQFLTEDEPVRRHILNIPEPMLIFAGVVGLLFSLLLAWNLTRPMRQLREAFASVASGNLAVRLYPVMRRRHDELSIVARDFDAMVERLAVLVSNREALLHDVSHELRSPLARLQLATGLARQRPNAVDAALERIDEEANRLDKMIGELLTLSRAENEGIVDEQYFDLRGLLDAVADDARFESQGAGVDIQLIIDNAVNDYTVRGNAELMRRAVENVVRNALRFSSAGQVVRIHLQHKSNQFAISVVDQGPGVDEDKLSSMFDPFVRVNSPLMGKGYGLGLSIVRKVVLAHNGTVKAISGKEGGLNLTIYLPRWQSSKH